MMSNFSCFDGFYFVFTWYRFKKKFMPPVLCSISKIWTPRLAEFDIFMRPSTRGPYFRYGTQWVTQSYNIVAQCVDPICEMTFCNFILQYLYLEASLQICCKNNSFIFQLYWTCPYTKVLIIMIESRHSMFYLHFIPSLKIHR